MVLVETAKDNLIKKAQQRWELESGGPFILIAERSLVSQCLGGMEGLMPLTHYLSH